MVGGYGFRARRDALNACLAAPRNDQSISGSFREPPDVDAEGLAQAFFAGSSDP